LAERGLQTVIQSVRGTFGSGGDFAPFDERADGLATLGWLRAQSWHAGPIAMMGPSYLGFVQWAVAPDAGEDLAALTIQVSASQFYRQTYAGGSLSLETIASWMVLVSAQERRAAPVAINRALRRLPQQLGELPLGGLDERATGAAVRWFREAFEHPARDDAYWAARDFSARAGEVRAPVQFVGRWNDILLPWMLEGYLALREAGHEPQLQIGPWTHTAPGPLAAPGNGATAPVEALGPVRVERDADGVWKVGFSRWPIGHRFASGHRIRLQVSSGAHPRYARNPGTGEDPATATELRPVEIEMLRGGAQASVLVLPRRAAA
jgi:uncharacterized protein